jgi:hypothetical protein
MNHRIGQILSEADGRAACLPGRERSTRSIDEVFAAADAKLRAPGEMSDRLAHAYPLLDRIDRSSMDVTTAADLDAAKAAMRAAAQGDLGGVASQYCRLASTTSAAPDTDRIFFTIWQRTGDANIEPCLLRCKVNRRNLDLLQITRSRPFVERVAHRLRCETYPEAVLSSRMQGVEILSSAGVRPHVLFADFVKMEEGAIDPATAGGLLFDSFGDGFLNEQMKRIERAFPGVVRWLEAKGVMNTQSFRLLTAAHVQAHDLCGHSVPYSLRHPTRLKADWHLRAPLEEYYADTQAMWIYSSPTTRPLLKDVLTETEMDVVPVLVAMKRMGYYAMLPVDDHDARSSWMFFGYFRKAGVIRASPTNPCQFEFDLDCFPAAVDQMLSDVLDIEHAIGDGVEAYEAACLKFSLRYGFENPVTRRWAMPDDLQTALGA